LVMYTVRGTFSATGTVTAQLNQTVGGLFFPIGQPAINNTGATIAVNRLCYCHNNHCT
jgi:hypothetical protein